MEGAGIRYYGYILGWFFNFVFLYFCTFVCLSLLAFSLFFLIFVVRILFRAWDLDYSILYFCLLKKREREKSLLCNLLVFSSVTSSCSGSRVNFHSPGHQLQEEEEEEAESGACKEASVQEDHFL